MFVLNGIQTQSGYCYNLIRDLPSMAGLVDVLRLSPQGDETWSWLAQFDQARTGQGPAVALQAGECNGYWHRIAGMSIQTE